jgi:hypothetical protein
VDGPDSGYALDLTQIALARSGFALSPSVLSLGPSSYPYWLFRYGIVFIPCGIFCGGVVGALGRASSRGRVAAVGAMLVGVSLLYVVYATASGHSVSVANWASSLALTFAAMLFYLVPMRRWLRKF